jgi:hypothetical protein
VTYGCDRDPRGKLLPSEHRKGCYAMTVTFPIRAVAWILFVFGLPGWSLAAAQAPQPVETAVPSIASRVAGLTRIDGLLPLYWDARQGRLLMELARFDTELLYAVSLPAGLGSNTVGLDRGQPGPADIVVFERVGPKVLLVARKR